MLAGRQSPAGNLVRGIVEGEEIPFSGI